MYVTNRSMFLIPSREGRFQIFLAMYVKRCDQWKAAQLHVCFAETHALSSYLPLGILGTQRALNRGELPVSPRRSLPRRLTIADEYLEHPDVTHFKGIIEPGLLSV